MKVVHICTNLNGGAGLCAKRIIKATQNLGIDARAITLESDLREPWIDVYDEPIHWSHNIIIKLFQKVLFEIKLWPKFKRYNRIINRAVYKKQNEGNDWTITNPITQYGNLHLHPWIQEADIIHLQWVGYFLNYETFFKNVQKPIIWTIHDESQGLGFFHYTIWKNNAPDYLKQLDDKISLIKKEAYTHANNMTLVAISTKMKNFFQTNNLLSGFKISLIHNGIMEKEFSIKEKEVCREELGIPQDATVYVFVAQNIYESRKGLKELVQSLEELKKQNTFLVCLGGNAGRVPQASFPVLCAGFVSNSNDLSKYYSASDYFVMPSYQEAFAQTPMEAMACGLPVISFPCSGAKDLINEQTGIVCQDFSMSALKEGIDKAHKTKYNRQTIRNYIIDNFSYEKIAGQYANLYKKVLE